MKILKKENRIKEKIDKMEFLKKIKNSLWKI